MKIFKSYLTFLLTSFYIFPLSASTTDDSKFKEQSAIGSCDLPAPKNLSVKGISTTWVALDWEGVQGANRYAITVFSAPTNTIVATWQIEGTSYTVGNLERGKEYYFQLSAVCNESGDLSPKTSNTSKIFTIVIDIKVNVENPDLPAMIPCQITNVPIGRCYFPCESSAFWGNIYKNQSYTTSFFVEPGDSTLFSNSKEVRFHKVANGSPNLSFKSNFGGSYGEANFIEVRDNAITVLLISFLKDPCAIEVQFVGNSYNNYVVRHLEFYTGGDYKLANTSNTTFEEAYSLKWPQQNPPEDTYNSASPPPTNCQLFNLNGTLQLEQILQPDQNYQDLINPGLPAGFYFVRLETGGIVEAHKLIKTQ